MRRAASLVALILALSITPFGVSQAAPADDGNGREWRQLYETTGLTWNQIAEVCPRDGVTPCSGSVGGKNLSRWVWATEDQVIGFMGQYAPALLTAEPPSLSGPEHFFSAVGVLNVMRWTQTLTSNYHHSEWTGGWTSSTNQDGVPIGGGAGFQHPIIQASLGVGPVANPGGGSQYMGVWMWRTAGLDYSAPVITPAVSGTKGNNNWYVSDVSIAWDVTDGESPIDSTTGCGTSKLVSDTSNKTYECSAQSFGGASESSVSVKRDVAPPTVSCGAPAPEFQLGELGAGVSASVSDTMSGPATTDVKGFANTNTVGSFTAPVTGKDNAGNSTTAQCKYEVLPPICGDLEPTTVGTPGNDVIKGTVGRDIIVSLGGSDTIDGRGGSDVICGGDAPDNITGGRGKDIVDGGTGDDSIFGSAGNDNLNGGLNNDSLRGDGGRDTCASGEIRMSSCEIEIDDPDDDPED